MLQMMYPDEYLESTYQIDFEEMYNKGYRGVLFDIDNTLVPHGAPADERAIALFRRLKEIGFQTFFSIFGMRRKKELKNDAFYYRIRHKNDLLDIY